MATRTSSSGRTTARAPRSTITAVIDQWIFVAMAAFFVVTALVGFVPDSIAKVATVRAGQRPPFPPVLHVHAVLMGAWLMLVLTQSWLAATGQTRWHRRLGVVGAALALGLVVAIPILLHTTYATIWEQVHNPPPTLPPAAYAEIVAAQGEVADVALGGARTAIWFFQLIVWAVIARRTDPSLHKRLMILATVALLPAAIDRITFLPSTMPASSLSPDLYPVLWIMPLFVWDLYRLRRIHRAYVIWGITGLVLSAPVYLLWNTPWWLATLPRIMGLSA